MPRTRSLAIGTAIILAIGLSVAGATPAAPEELPPGFTDGRPVGDEAGGTDARLGTAEAGPAATTTRYFGAGAFDAVRAAAVGTSRSCQISDDGLIALALAPVFKESSAATTPSTAPSPMTLSRYDEWSGTFGTDTSRNANYGLYAFRDPFTSYDRAYWNPGIGIWQYDSAGLGAPLTTVEAMDVGVVAADVARIMATRYCNPSPTVVGHGAPFTDQERRYSAWGDWGYPCTLCQQYFAEMTASRPYFDNVELVAGIGRLGGVVERTCTLPGVPGTVRCWYVEPVVGVIQGATAWATLSPVDGGDPTVAPAPLSAPFYVVDRGTTEERHWLRADTGYGIDVKASRTIGKNARPRSNQTGSGLTWSSSSGLCDVSLGRGACGPVPPSGVTSSSITVAGTYRAVALDAQGDGRGDVLWYAPGSAADSLWSGTGPGTFSSSGVAIAGSYGDVLAGDVDGDGDDDLVFYESSTGRSFLWRSRGDGTFATLNLQPGSGMVPRMLDTDANGAQELLWYGPGSRADSLWHWNGTGFSASARSVSGSYQPIIGDFDGNGRDDIFWYAPGPASDHLWLHKVGGGYLSVARPVSGSYRWRTGDLDGDGATDLLWYAPGGGADSIWFGGPGASFDNRSVTVNGDYQPIVLDLFDTGGDAVVWYAPGATGDSVWTFGGGRGHTSDALVLPGAQTALPGPYSPGAEDGIVWFGAGAIVDSVWHR